MERGAAGIVYELAEGIIGCRAPDSVMIRSCKGCKSASHTAYFYAVCMAEQGQLNGSHAEQFQHVAAREFALRHFVRVVADILALRVKGIVNAGHVVRTVARMQFCERARKGAVFIKRNIHLAR